MPLTATRARSRPRRTLITVLCGLLPMLSGLGMLYVQAERTLEQQTSQAAAELLRQIERMLDNTAMAARELLPLAGQPCETVQLALREQVTRRPYVRSTNLVWDDTLYCSSLFGAHEERANPNDYHNGALWLMNGNPVTPDTALLIYRLQEGQRWALATLDGYHLTNVLQLIGGHTHMFLQVGPSWLAADGKVRQTPMPSLPVAMSDLSSARYPFRVEAGFDEGEVWRYMAHEYPPLFSLLMVFGAIAGTLGHWLQKRASSPRHELQRALDAGEFVPYLQPVVHGNSKRWAGVEVLMRWNHPVEGLVRPDLFIPLAEHSGLIVPMTRSLMQQTLQLLVPLVPWLQPPFHVGINITARHCQNLELLEDCREFLDAFPPGTIVLVLELTERELIEPSPTTHQLFGQLRDMGVRIAIDDFGTGHSSLAYLRQFNVDFLKIDQSFVAMIGADALSRHILDSIIELSGKLDLAVVAEGVETVEQADYLSAHGVNFLQGYLFGRPTSGPDFVHTLKTINYDHRGSSR